MMQPKETVEQRKITRTEIAQWYDISERGLRDRMHKKAVQVSNRILTECDIRLILKGLGKPLYMPPDLYHFYFFT